MSPWLQGALEDVASTQAAVLWCELENCSSKEKRRGSADERGAGQRMLIISRN